MTRRRADEGGRFHEASARSDADLTSEVSGDVDPGVGLQRAGAQHLLVADDRAPYQGLGPPVSGSSRRTISANSSTGWSLSSASTTRSRSSVT